MSGTYVYNDSKVIDGITFRETGKGAVRAYLHAHKDAEPATLQKIADTFSDQNYQCIPYILDGQPVLEVRGLKTEASINKILVDNNWVEGQRTSLDDKTAKHSFIDKLRKRSLQASGAAYLVGDAGFFAYNFKEADKLGMAGAFSYFLGTLSLLFYGRNDQSNLQVKDFAKDVHHFLENENVKVSEGSALHELTKKKPKDTLASLDEFCKRYPAEIFNTVTALAGVFVAASAYTGKVKGMPKPDMNAQAIRKMRQEGRLDVGLGITTAVSGVLATVIKEKKHDPDAPPAKGFGWVKEKIQEHPLAIAGGGYTIATIFHAISTGIAYKEAKRMDDKVRLSSVPKRALFVSMAFLSEFLLAISSKGHGQGVVSDTSVDDSVMALASDLISLQPRDKQDHLIDSMSKFLSGPEVLALKDKDVRGKLQTQVEAMRKNPWAAAVELPKDTPPKEEPATKWQAKIEAAPAQNQHAVV